MNNYSWINGDIVGGWWVVDGGVEMIMIQAHIDFKKYDLGGRGEFDRIAAFEAFKELDEGIGSMWP